MQRAQINTKLNKTDNLILLIYFTVAAWVWIVDYIEEGLNEPSHYLLDIPIILGSTYLAILLLIKVVYPKYLFENPNLFVLFTLTLVVIIILGLLHRWIQAYTSDWLHVFWGENPVYVIKSSIIQTSQNIGLPLGMLLTKKYYESQFDLSRVQQLQRENELKLLRSQVDPHFLFNNLNTLDSLIATNPQQAHSYIEKLSSLYRYLIRTKDEEVMELTDELEMAKNYIYLIETRFGDDYVFTFENNAAISGFLPTGALQIVLENVCKHNRAIVGTQIKTQICIDETYITITNNKSIYQPKDTSGTGIQNLKDRYSLLGTKSVWINEGHDSYEIQLPILKLSN